jgi:arylsulfatase A-like enzyme
VLRQPSPGDEHVLRRTFLQSTALIPCFIASAAERKPNVVLVLTDQWRGQTFPGVSFDLRAPSLRRLAEEGITFPRSYTSYPQSGPARAALLSGRFPHACGVLEDDIQMPLDQPTLSMVMREAGYRTGFIGKWGLDGAGDPGFVPPGPRRRGFDYWAAFNRGNRFYESLYFRDTAEPILASGFEPDYQTDLALDFIKQNRENPFFLFLSWGPPHPPRNPPERVADLYTPAKLTVRGNVPEELESRAQIEYASYYAICTALDQCLGRVLDALDSASLREDTIVVFTSTSGTMLASQGLEDTGFPFEECLRVPLLMRYPRLGKAGIVRDDLLVSNVDLAPTLLSICGIATPTEMQGANLAPGFSGQEAIFAETKQWRAVVRGLDKLVVNRELEATDLYNLGQDPLEQENLVRSRHHQRKKDELNALLREWMRRTQFQMDASGLKKRK